MSYLRDQTARETHTTHGMSYSPEYRVWQGMRNRCYLESSISYRNYGARGIRVCDEWSKFENFFADMGTRPPGTWLDRIDNDLDYRPENCAWRTPKEQMRNNNRTRHIVFRGERMCVKDACLLLGIHPAQVATRVKRKGCSHQDAVDYFAMKEANGERSS